SSEVCFDSCSPLSSEISCLGVAPCGFEGSARCPWHEGVGEAQLRVQCQTSDRGGAECRRVFGAVDIDRGLEQVGLTLHESPTTGQTTVNTQSDQGFSQTVDGQVGQFGDLGTDSLDHRPYDLGPSGREP